jgi:hypothetical protein
MQYICSTNFFLTHIYMFSVKIKYSSHFELINIIVLVNSDYFLERERERERRRRI